MTIDEAIAHEREVAEEQRKDNDNCKYKSQYGCKDCADYYSKPCIECAKEHEQLAEWLEELKSYRVSVFSGDMTQKMLKEQYNKAIDDYMNKLCNHCMKETNECNKLECPFCTDGCDIVKIAEQLKAGGENE